MEAEPEVGLVQDTLTVTMIPQGLSLWPFSLKELNAP